MEGFPDQQLSPKKDCGEVKIPMPWGFVSGKWWGSHSIRPIVAIHGWQDNAGSFDTLVPQLPDYISVLALDLPGHGYSPRIPDGMAFHSLDLIHLLNTLITYFQWEKISLMAHSLGAVYCFFFAGMFPQKVDMVIALDALKPHIASSESSLTFAASRINVATMADQIAIELGEEPSYSYEELVEKMHLGSFGSISKDSCLYILARNVTASNKYPGRFNIINKHLEKSFGKEAFTQDLNLRLARNIKIPYLFIKAARSPLYADKKNFIEVLEMMSRNEYFEFHNVNGTHHIHLNEPEKVSHIISNFIDRHSTPF